MNETEFNSLRERAWNGQLTSEEREALEAGMQSRDGRQGVDDEELALAIVVSELQNVPVPSNFTNRVLSAVQGELRIEPKRASWKFSDVLLKWPKLVAGCSMSLAVFVLASYSYFAHVRRETAQGVAAVSSMASAGLLAIAVTGEAPAENGNTEVKKSSLPPVEVFQDFEAIRRLSHMPDVSDAQLMNYLQD